MARLTLEGWRLFLEGELLGTIGRSDFYNSGFTYYRFEAAPAFATVQTIFTRVNETWLAMNAFLDDAHAAEYDRLEAIHEAADRKRAALPLELVSPDGAIALGDAIIHVHPEDLPPITRIKLLPPAYDALRAAGRL